MAKKKISREESDYMSHVCNVIGCIVCGKPAEPHHIRGLTTLGMGQKAGNFLVVPLCREHHLEIHDRMSVGGVAEHELLNETVARMWGQLESQFGKW